MGYPREEAGAGNPPARICEGEAEWPSYSTTTAILRRTCHPGSLAARLQQWQFVVRILPPTDNSVMVRDSKSNAMLTGVASKDTILMSVIVHRFT